MIPFPNTFDNELQALPLEQMDAAGTQAVIILKSKGYEVQVGLTPKYADAIAAMANEESIREYCPKDSGERFTTRQTTAEWLSKERATYLLLQKSDDGSLELAGYGWIGTKQSARVPGGETTFSLRVGEGHQGKGLAEPFSVAMLAAATAQYSAPHMWLETWASNGGAVHIYHKIGFVDVDAVDDERPTISGGTLTDTRLFMVHSSDIQNTQPTSR
jgi:ribosomal protein S18 acetylase RimI-like enzyme